MSERTRTRCSLGTLRTSYVAKGQEFRKSGGGWPHDWWGLGSYQFYYSGFATSTEYKSERMTDRMNSKWQNNPVDHVKMSCRPINGGSLGPIYVTSRIENSQEWNPFSTPPGMTTVTTEYADVYYLINNGWTPFSTEGGVQSVAHVCTPSLYEMKIRSIFDDATKLFPKEQNFALIMGELSECKNLFKSFSDIFKQFASKSVSGTGKGLAGSYLMETWGIDPGVKMIRDLKGINDRLYDRVALLMKRKRDKLTKINRKWTETEDMVIDGRTCTVQTVNCLSCKMVANISATEEALCQAMVNRIAGLTSIFNTMWQLSPFSFAVDALAHTYGQKSFVDIADQLDALLEESNLWANSIALPTESSVTTANWSFSQKTIATWQVENKLCDGPDDLTTLKALMKVERFSRGPLDMSTTLRSRTGIPPNLGLAASLGVVTLNGRLR